jgi:hypothetical protein
MDDIFAGNTKFADTGLHGAHTPQTHIVQPYKGKTILKSKLRTGR